MQVEVDRYGRRLVINRPLVQQEDMLWDFGLFDPWRPNNTGLYGPSADRSDLRNRGADDGPSGSIPGLGGCGSCTQAPCSSWVSYFSREQQVNPRGPVYSSYGFGPVYSTGRKMPR